MSNRSHHDGKDSVLDVVLVNLSLPLSVQLPGFNVGLVNGPSEDSTFSQSTPLKPKCDLLLLLISRACITQSLTLTLIVVL